VIWAKCFAQTREVRYFTRVLMGKPLGQQPVERVKECENNINGNGLYGC
jgi:hypothetical protein